MAGLLALGTAGFITIMTEALPAGILPAMSSDLGVTEAATGQTVTVYAIGSAVAAVLLTAATIRWSRRRLLLFAIAGFAVANTITAVSHDYALTMVARFVAGVVAGLEDSHRRAELDSEGPGQHEHLTKRNDSDR